MHHSVAPVRLLVNRLNTNRPNWGPTPLFCPRMFWLDEEVNIVKMKLMKIPSHSLVSLKTKSIYSSWGSLSICSINYWREKTSAIDMVGFISPMHRNPAGILVPYDLQRNCLFIAQKKKTIFIGIMMRKSVTTKAVKEMQLSRPCKKYSTFGIKYYASIL